MMPSLPLLLILLTVGERVTAWNNDWDRDLLFRCPRAQAVSRIASYHNNHHEDRRWDIRCKAAPSFNHCYWSGWVNNFDHPLNFRCHDNYVITGMHSYHNNHHEDRRWEYLCCKSSRLVTYGCHYTYYVNDWDNYFAWRVPGGSYLTGVMSYHNNHHEDRRWRFRYCRGRTR